MGGLNMYDSFVRARILTYLKKNKDYGNSFADSISALGDTAGLVRILDKVNRLKSLLKMDSSEVAESLEDTVLDLFNYVVMFECAKEGTDKLIDIVETTMDLVEHYREFAETVNSLFEQDFLRFNEEESRQVNNLLWGCIVSFV